MKERFSDSRCASRSWTRRLQYAGDVLSCCFGQRRERLPSREPRRPVIQFGVYGLVLDQQEIRDADLSFTVGDLDQRPVLPGRYQYRALQHYDFRSGRPVRNRLEAHDLLREGLPDRAGWNVKILATDLDTRVLEIARAGEYEAERVRNVASERLQRFFQCGTGANLGKVRIGSELRQLITFKQLNLIDTWPMRGPFDVIFCRNVVIYFDLETQSRLFGRFADILRDDGYLFVGHSETLQKVTNRFELAGQPVYRIRS